MRNDGTHKLRPLALERYFARWEFHTRHLLCASDCEPLSVRELLDLTSHSAEELLDTHLGYVPTLGDPELRRAIAATYDSLDDTHVLVAAPQEALFLTMTALLEPGDRVIVQTPFFQPLGEVARARGCELVRWPLVETAEQWKLDLGHLERLLGKPTKMLIVNFPHNPTGFVPNLEEFSFLSGAAVGAGAWLFSDEIYRGLELKRRALPSAADLDYSRVISLGGLSKALGLPGLRLGWLATKEKPLLERLHEIKDYTTICNTAPSQKLGLFALEQRELLLQRSLSIVRSNLGVWLDFLSQRPGLFHWLPPDSGPLAFPRLLAGSADAFCARVREHADVLLAPSTLFSFGDEHVRLGFGRKPFAEGLDALDRYLSKGLS